MVERDLLHLSQLFEKKWSSILRDVSEWINDSNSFE